MSTSQKEELKNAADSFVTSLRKVKGVSLTDEQAGAVGAAVATVGGLFVEHLRARATRQVVAVHARQRAPGGGARRARLRPPGGPLEPWLRQGGGGAPRRGRAGPAGARDQRPRPSVGRRCWPIRTNSGFRAVGADVGKSAATLRVAQVNLREALEKPRIGLEDINAYVSQVEELVTAYRVLRDRQEGARA